MLPKHIVLQQSIKIETYWNVNNKSYKPTNVADLN